jgi:uncharacterized SAM-binding protein YcdF (DUF218 family)
MRRRRTNERGRVSAAGPMFFVLAKILGFFALPSNLLVVAGLLGVVLMATRFARAGRALAAFSLVLLALVGLTPLGNALILPLEQRFPRWVEAGRPPDGIVVLGGAFDTLVSQARGEVALTDAGDRMTGVAELARRFPNARILISGGSGRLLLHGANEGELALRLLESFGIARGRILLDDRSRDTLENAEFSKAVAAPGPGELWLLVTSAYHMPRSIGAFRRAGFPVQPYPADWRTRGESDLLRPFDSVADGLKRSDTAVREYVGLITYWASGRTSELFPGPVTAGCDRAAKDACRP